MKKCCLTQGHQTCADCLEYDECEILQAFLNHPGYKYAKYKLSLEFLRSQGPVAFVEAARNWKKVYGKF